MKQHSIDAFVRREICNPMKAKKITAVISKMVACESLPISFVEMPTFRELMNQCEPGKTVLRMRFSTAKDEL